MKACEHERHMSVVKVSEKIRKVGRVTMRSFATAIFLLTFSLLAGRPKTLTTDPLTGLPLIPATDSRLHLGNDPTILPDSQICKSKMQTDFYSVFDTKVDTTLAWYSSRLPGFKKTHGYAAGRSQDTFYSPDGTVIVSVTGEPGKDGENANAYSVLYAKFQPGLSEKTIVGMNTQKITCP
jgi:hypothetical protein